MACISVASVLPVNIVSAQSTEKDKKIETVAQFPDISVADLQVALKASKATIIDCNNEKSYNSGHVPGALHFASVKVKIAEVLPKDKSALIVSYCSGPQ